MADLWRFRCGPHGTILAKNLGVRHSWPDSAIAHNVYADLASQKVLDLVLDWAKTNSSYISRPTYTEEGLFLILENCETQTGPF